MKKILIGLLLLGAIGLAGHIDYQDQLTEQAEITCHNQDSTTTPSKEQCIDNLLEMNGDK